jgi:hypothetical protein
VRGIGARGRRSVTGRPLATCELGAPRGVRFPEEHPRSLTPHLGHASGVLAPQKKPASGPPAIRRKKVPYRCDLLPPLCFPDSSNPRHRFAPHLVANGRNLTGSPDLSRRLATVDRPSYRPRWRDLDRWRSYPAAGLFRLIVAAATLFVVSHDLHLTWM